MSPSPSFFNLSRLAFKQTLRDLKSGELFLLSLCLIVAVSASTSINFFSDRIQKVLIVQSNELLAADLRLESRNASNNNHLEQLIQRAKQNGFVDAQFISTQGVVRTEKGFSIAEIKAVGQGYPLRGNLEIRDTKNEQALITKNLPSGNEIWLDPVLMSALQIDLNETVTIGNQGFRFTKILSYEPDRGGNVFNTSPRAMIAFNALETTQLIQPGSRANYVWLLKSEDQNKIEQFAEQIREDALSHGIQVKSIKNHQPRIKNALERGESFMKMAAFISLSLAACGIALSAHRFAYKAWEQVAILNTLGLQKKQIFLLYTLELSLIGLFAAIIASIIGYLSQLLLGQILQTLDLAASLPQPSIKPIFIGLLLSLVTILGFALPALLRLRNVSAMNVLRNDHTQINHQSTWKTQSYTYAWTTLALSTLAFWQIANLKMSAWLLFTLLSAIIIFFLFTTAALSLFSKLSHPFKTLSALNKRLQQYRSTTILQISIIAFTSCILMMMLIVKNDLISAWGKTLPDKAPNQFAFNIPSQEVPALRNSLQEKEVKDFTLYPMVRGRIVGHNQQAFSADSVESEEAKRLARREYSFSWTTELPKANTLVAGTFPPQIENSQELNTPRIGISVEDRWAERFGFKLGDQVSFNIQGQIIDAYITSFRNINWESVEVNFFILFPENLLNDYPQTWITAFHWPHSKSELLTIVDQFPAMTLLDVEDIIAKIRELIDRVSLAITMILLFTIVAGLLVLIIAIQSTLQTRSIEIALFKTFGTEAKRIWSMMLTEFFFIGLIGGLLAAIFAFLSGSLLSYYLFDLVARPNILQLLFGVAFTIIFVVFSSLWVCLRTLRVPPTYVLRRN